MAGRGAENFMFYQSSRYQPFGLTHNPIMGNSMMGQQMMNSSLYKNIHCLKTEMPSDVLELFKANEIGYVRPIRKRKCRSLDPLSAATFNIMDRFTEPSAMEVERPPVQTKQYKRDKRRQEKAEAARAVLEENLLKWNPFEEKNINSDPYKTLIVARLKYETPERTIKLEFEKYGVVKSVQLVVDKTGKSRGYAFVEFERREDFINAYKNAHLKRIDGRRVIVDVEKGRSILLWRPRRLGGGEGTLRLTKQEVQARERVKNLQQELKENRRRERGDQERKEREHHREGHSRSRSRDRKEKKAKDKDKDKEREKDRERDRGDRADRERDRDRDHSHDRHRDAERADRSQRDRHKRSEGEENGGKDKKEKDRKKDRSRSHKKKKERKERKEYVAMNVPVDEFR